MHETGSNFVCVGEHLTKRYGDKYVVEDVSFTVSAGEVLGILGPNGAGKSTTIGMTYGLVKPDQGTLRVGGFDITTDGRKARSILGVVSQENNLDPDFTARENLRYFAMHFGYTGKANASRVDESLHLVRMESYQNQRVETLSGGLQRRLVLARALLGRPKLILLDEPTTGLDPDARQDFWRIVAELRDAGAGLLLTTHYMDEAERLCDRLLLMRSGKIINEGSPSELILQTVGDEVLECEGVDGDALERALAEHRGWTRPFGRGAVIGSESGNIEPMWNEMTKHGLRRLTRRKSDLQDVFLKLTGEKLE